AFAAGLQDLTLESGSLRQLEASVATMEMFDNSTARESRRKLNERFVAVIQKAINQPKLTDEMRDRIGSALDRLATRDSDAANRLRQDLTKRLGSWEVATDLAKPFPQLTAVFGTGRVTLADDRLKTARVLSGSEVAGQPIPDELPVKTQLGAVGSLRCEAVFAEDWDS